MSEPTQNRSARRGARRREMIRGIIPTDGSPGSRRVSRDAAWALRHRLRRHERSIEKRTITVRLKPDTTAVTFASAIQVTNVEISLTTSAVSRHTLSVQAAVAGSHKLRVGGGGRVFRLRRSPFSDVRPQRSTSLRGSLTVLPTKHLFGHTGTMTTRANSRCRQAGRLFILPVTIRGPHLHTGIPAYRHHHAAAREGARRQNSS